MADSRSASMDIMPLHSLEKEMFRFLNTSADYASHIGLLTMLLDDEAHHERAYAEEDDSQQMTELKDRYLQMIRIIQEEMQDLILTLNRIHRNEEIVESLQRLEGYINDYLNA